MSIRDKYQAKRSKPKKRAPVGSKVRRTVPQVSIGSQFRKVARELVRIEIDGIPQKISRWEAYVHQIYNMALSKNNSAARLLDQLRSHFPGDLLPGDPITFIIREEDAML